MNYGLTGFERVRWKTRRWFHILVKKFLKSYKINWPKYIDKTYILHLEDRLDRKGLLSKQLKTVKTYTGNLLDHVIWWPAVKNLISWPRQWHIDKYSFEFHWVIDPDPYFKPNDKFMIQCSNAETAIAIGHIQMWKDFLASDAETALFLEDDVYFAYDFEKKVTSIFENELPGNWDILYLSALPNYHGFIWDPYSENVIKLYSGVWWMSGYCLTRKAAQYLLDNLPIVGPIDVWINYQFEELETFMSKENLIVQGDTTPSDNTYSFVDEFY